MIIRITTGGLKKGSTVLEVPYRNIIRRRDIAGAGYILLRQVGG